MSIRTILSGLAAALLFTSLPAQAADLRAAPAQAHQAAPVVVHRARVPACDDPRVLAQIEDQFEYGAPRVERQPLQVAQFAELFERAYFPVGGLRNIERRYCQGQALISGDAVSFSDSKSGMPYTTVYYVIEHPLGFASIGWRAEGCFLGYDRWRVYGANCESLRRF